MTKKESHRSPECLEQSKASLPSETKGPLIADRECDINEYFELAQDLELEVLVRLQHNRVEDIFMEEKVRGHLDVHIPGNGSRLARDAKMAVKFKEICFQANPREIKTPRTKSTRDLVLNIVVLSEVDAPKDIEALGWTLITSLPTSSLEDAEEVMKVYRMRWRIGLYFNVIDYNLFKSSGLCRKWIRGSFRKEITFICSAGSLK